MRASYTALAGQWGALLRRSRAPAAAALAQHQQQQQQQRAFTTIPEPDDTHLYAQSMQQPHWVEPISVVQLDNLCRHPTLHRLANSCTFLKLQLPLRLDNHIHRLQAVQGTNPTVAGLLEERLSEKRDLLRVMDTWRAIDTSTIGGAERFEPHLRAFKASLEQEMAALNASARRLTEQQDWWRDRRQTQALNRVLDLSHWYLLSTRVMLTQHLAALHALMGLPPAAGARGAPLHPDLPDSAPPTTRAHRTESLVLRGGLVRSLLELGAEDCRAFCIEKNSAAPGVVFVGGEDLHATILDSYVQFIFTEVLKNAMQSLVRKHGAWDVDEAPPVEVTLTDLRPSREFEVRVVDTGHGIPDAFQANMYNYFYSSSRPAHASYGYSRSHGSPFNGLGVGVPLSRVYAAFMGGHIHWETGSWYQNTSVILRLPKHGFVF